MEGGREGARAGGGRVGELVERASENRGGGGSIPPLASGRWEEARPMDVRGP